ncbi:sucB [Carpediemonas membranifera]|uniref:SucB n=1 Tax=Carpediemonas membranifera TaxID=201153 RepID=A0A8J6AWW5_9EUKA|nr:sucB [Carpediemonas membranifera]|eukprot:KAG9394520.1 sucB [Carpediemonas membranifera]
MAGSRSTKPSIVSINRLIREARFIDAQMALDLFDASADVSISTEALRKCLREVFAEDTDEETALQGCKLLAQIFQFKSNFPKLDRLNPAKLISPTIPKLLASSWPVYDAFIAFISSIPVSSLLPSLLAWLPTQTSPRRLLGVFSVFDLMETPPIIDMFDTIARVPDPALCWACLDSCNTHHVTPEQVPQYIRKQFTRYYDKPAPCMARKLFETLIQSSPARDSVSSYTIDAVVPDLRLVDTHADFGLDSLTLMTSAGLVTIPYSQLTKLEISARRMVIIVAARVSSSTPHASELRMGIHLKLATAPKHMTAAVNARVKAAREAVKEVRVESASPISGGGAVAQAKVRSMATPGGDRGEAPTDLAGRRKTPTAPATAPLKKRARLDPRAARSAPPKPRPRAMEATAAADEGVDESDVTGPVTPPHAPAPARKENVGKTTKAGKSASAARVSGTTALTRRADTPNQAFDDLNELVHSQQTQMVTLDEVQQRLDALRAAMLVEAEEDRKGKIDAIDKDLERSLGSMRARHREALERRAGEIRARVGRAVDRLKNDLRAMEATRAMLESTLTAQIKTVTRDKSAVTREVDSARNELMGLVAAQQEERDAAEEEAREAVERVNDMPANVRGPMASMVRQLDQMMGRVSK